MVYVINSLPYNKILDWSKFKAHACDNINVTPNLNFVLARIENILGKGENAGHQHFLLFPQCFLLIPKRTSVVMLHLFYRLQIL